MFSVKTELTCSLPPGNAVLRNHVIAKYLVTSEVECGYQCTRDSKCLSFNYKDHSASNSLLHECEINDYKQQNDPKGIVGLDGFSYYEREVHEHKLKLKAFSHDCML